MIRKRAPTMLCALLIMVGVTTTPDAHAQPRLKLEDRQKYQMSDRDITTIKKFARDLKSTSTNCYLSACTKGVRRSCATMRKLSGHIGKVRAILKTMRTLLEKDKDEIFKKYSFLLAKSKSWTEARAFLLWVQWVQDIFAGVSKIASDTASLSDFLLNYQQKYHEYTGKKFTTLINTKVKQQDRMLKHLKSTLEKADKVVKYAFKYFTIDVGKEISQAQRLREKVKDIWSTADDLEEAIREFRAAHNAHKTGLSRTASSKAVAGAAAVGKLAVSIGEKLVELDRERRTLRADQLKQEAGNIDKVTKYHFRILQRIRRRLAAIAFAESALIRADLWLNVCSKEHCPARPTSVEKPANPVRRQMTLAALNIELQKSINFHLDVLYFKLNNNKNIVKIISYIGLNKFKYKRGQSINVTYTANACVAKAAFIGMWHQPSHAIDPLARKAIVVGPVRTIVFVAPAPGSYQIRMQRPGAAAPYSTAPFTVIGGKGGSPKGGFKPAPLRIPKPCVRQRHDGTLDHSACER
jgi:hypothetical protein